MVHVKDPLDDDPPPPREEKGGPPPPQPPEAGMSYVAYFRGDKEDGHRPITFLYNGGPGLIDCLAAHGRLRTEAGGHGR